LIKSVSHVSVIFKIIIDNTEHNNTYSIKNKFLDKPGRYIPPSVIHFEISANQPEWVVKFYTTAFGWKIEKWGTEDYWLATTGESPEPGIDGAIQKSKLFLLCFFEVFVLNYGAKTSKKSIFKSSGEN